MGIQFPIRFTNLMAYFTTSMRTVECAVQDYVKFFDMLSSDEWRIISGRDPADWREKLSNVVYEAAGIARAHMSRSDESYEYEQNPTKHVTDIRAVFSGRTDVLRELKSILSDFDLFALGVATGRDAEEMVSRLRAVADEEQFTRTLFLIPDAAPDRGDTIDFYSPFPGAALICRHPERWPGVLIWQADGTSEFWPLRPGIDLLGQMATNLRPNFSRRRRFLRAPISDDAVRFLHLSDLHCGSDHTEAMKSILLTAVADKFDGQFDRVIITGDLFDSPRRSHWKSFEKFRRSLREVARSAPIIIPGNHDTRIKGNALWWLGKHFRQAAELEWKRVECDPATQTVFLCFDSSKTGSWARGEVTVDDLEDVAADFEDLARENPDIKNWLRIALVHHHPFAFEADAEGWTTKALQHLRIPEGSVMDMANSERFVGWCAKLGVRLILFGHRHVQRKITKSVPFESGSYTDHALVTAIGCGTSLGAEGSPLTLNIVNWDPIGRRWAVEFFEDDDGRGFKKPARSTVSV